MYPNVQELQILLVEDNLNASESIEDLLAGVMDIPYNIVSVSFLSQALEYLTQERYDIVLLDINLPDCSPLDSIIRIKELVSRIPIVVLTSINDKNFALEAVRQGAQDYLPKGQFDGELLSRTINYAIERQRIKDELQQQIERERLMSRMIRKIRYSLDLRIILETTVEEVRHFLNTERVIIYCCQELEASRIAAKSVISSEEKEDLTSTFFLTVNELNKTAEQLIQQILNTILVVPIWQNKPNQKPVLWGQLIAQDTRKTRQWQPWEIDFLTQLADHLAIAIQQSELYQTLEKQALLDGLTGIANRRQFDQFLQKVWRNLSTTQEPLSIIMIDVDFFSEYNNTYGHLAGDDCLKQVAQTIQKASQRSTDLACRYGGEEFALILPKTNTEGALNVAHNIQQNIKQLQLLHISSTINNYVTISAGLATCIPTLEGLAENLLELADQALRQAKQEGRNRLVISQIPLQ